MVGKHARTLIYFYPDKFKRLCEETGLTVEELVVDAKISKRALLAYRGKEIRGCRRDTFIMIAEYFGWENVFPVIKKGEVIAIGLYERQRKLNPDLPPLKTILEKPESTRRQSSPEKDIQEQTIEPKLTEDERRNTCPNCSAEQEDGAKFCFKCGHSLKPDEHNEPTTTYTIETDNEFDALKKAYIKYIERHRGMSFSGGEILELEELETIPSAVIINKFCMEAYSVFRELEDPELFGGSGHFLNQLIKKALEKHDKISISCKGRPYGIGANLANGLLELEGDVGGGLGMEMSNGVIRLKGDAGHHLGYEMTGGKIIIEGNTGKETGERMKGGSITINGNAGDYLGLNMEDELIEVSGNANEYTGRNMKGGTIKVSGNAGDKLGDKMEGGKIIIGGNVTGSVGRHMINGIIIIEGNVILGECSDYCSIGDGMAGGRITIKGDIIKNGDYDHLVGYGIAGGELVIEGDLRNASISNNHSNVFHKSIAQKNKKNLSDKLLRFFKKI